MKRGFLLSGNGEDGGKIQKQVPSTSKQGIQKKVKDNDKGKEKVDSVDASKIQQQQQNQQPQSYPPKEYVAKMLEVEGLKEDVNTLKKNVYITFQKNQFFFPLHLITYFFFVIFILSMQLCNNEYENVLQLFNIWKVLNLHNIKNGCGVEVSLPRCLKRMHEML